jgi:prevent-host-death family protein
MKTMVVSEFKAKCIAALKEVQESGKPLLVTLRGEPLATVQPVAKQRPRKRLGTLKGSVTIRGDLVHVDAGEEWEMLH